MLNRTHLAVGLAMALYFLPHMNDKILFVPIVLIASVLPNLGLIISSRKGVKIKRPLGRTTYLGKVVNSYTFCMVITLAIALLYPVLAFPFFLGYSMHLFLDAFTPDGIVPFWPFIKKESKGSIGTGGKIDNAIFVIMILVDVGLFVKLFV